VIDRLVDPTALEQVVLASLAAIAVGGGAFAATVMWPHGLAVALRAAGLTAANGLIALAAALGPIWAASVLVSARLPLSRLVGAILTAAGTGALILAACMPIPHLLQRCAPEYGRAIALLSCFAFTGIAAGARLHRTLMLMAERIKAARSSDPLTPEEQYRVAIIARTAMMFLAFSIALSMWGFDAFVA
jgi:hypothetical protein